MGMRAAVAVLILAAAGGAAHADNREVARQSYIEGKRLYDVGEYESALAAFKKAYINYEEPTFLFNAAQCYRQLGDRKSAVRQFQTFLRNYPKAPNRASVERIIGELQDGAGTPAAIAAAPATSTPATSTPATSTPATSTPVASKPAVSKPAANAPRVATATQPRPSPAAAPAATTPPEPAATTSLKSAPPPGEVTAAHTPSRAAMTEMEEVTPDFEHKPEVARPNKRWWIWLTVGAVVVAGVAVAVAVPLSLHSQPQFKSSLPDFNLTSPAASVRF